MTWETFCRLVKQGVVEKVVVTPSERKVAAYFPRRGRYGGCWVTMLDVSDERLEEFRKMCQH